MIPRIIHYVWFGNPMPKRLREYMRSWEKLTGYEVKCWDESKFDIHSNPFVEQAYRSGRYAFCADYIRLHALYTEGGIYLDTDVEILKSFDDLLDLPYFLGQEDVDGNIASATMGFCPGHPLIAKVMQYYEGRPFILEDGKCNMKTIPVILKEVIAEDYSIKQIKTKEEFSFESRMINLFVQEYFSPTDYNHTENKTTQNTYTIHHFDGSWLVPRRDDFEHFFDYIRVRYGLRTHLMQWIGKIMKKN